MCFGVNANVEQVLYVEIPYAYRYRQAYMYTKYKHWAQNKNELNFQKSLFQNSNSYIISYVEYVGRFDFSILPTSDKAQLDFLCELVNLENNIPKNI